MQKFTTLLPSSPLSPSSPSPLPPSAPSPSLVVRVELHTGGSLAAVQPAPAGGEQCVPSEERYWDGPAAALTSPAGGERCSRRRSVPGEEPQGARDGVG